MDAILWGEPPSGLANCRYVAHQSDRQSQIAPKSYIVRQEMTPEIAHVHVDRLQNGIGIVFSHT